MSFYHGILNLTNWAGNVIMPTLGALFIALAVIQFARGYHHLYCLVGDICGCQRPFFVAS
jgi:hypothetical protein